MKVERTSAGELAPIAILQTRKDREKNDSKVDPDQGQDLARVVQDHDQDPRLRDHDLALGLNHLLVRGLDQDPGLHHPHVGLVLDQELLEVHVQDQPHQALEVILGLVLAPQSHVVQDQPLPQDEDHQHLRGDLLLGPVGHEAQYNRVQNKK